MIHEATFFGVPDGTVFGLLSSTAFAIHLVRSEVRQHDAKDVGQLAAGQLVVCAIFINLWAGVDIFATPDLLAQATHPAALFQVRELSPLARCPLTVSSLLVPTRDLPTHRV